MKWTYQHNHSNKEVLKKSDMVCSWMTMKILCKLGFIIYTFGMQFYNF